MSAKKPWCINVISEASPRPKAALGRTLAVLALLPILLIVLGSFLPSYPLRILDSKDPRDRPTADSAPVMALLSD